MKRGFTLIELLAVIVILAIIAIIATPIVLSIIKNSKTSSSLRSAENYLNVVENAIAKENLSGKEFNPLSCAVISDDGKKLSCKMSDNTTQDLNIDVSGSVPGSGTITFANGKVDKVINIKLDNNYINKTEGELVYTNDVLSICKLVSGKENTYGSKYECEVKKDIRYNFYVLGINSDGTYNLILDHNITNTGKLVEKNSGEGLTSWSSSQNYQGPVKAMEYLYNATKDWTNVSILDNYIYNDLKNIDGKFVAYEIDGTEHYTSLVVNNGIMTITPKLGSVYAVNTIGTSSEPLRARLPIYSKDTKLTELLNKTDSTAFLYDNLDPSGTTVKAPYGYWTASSCSDFSDSAWYVPFDGNLGGADIRNNSGCGVRPVITVEI